MKHMLVFATSFLGCMANDDKWDAWRKKSSLSSISMVEWKEIHLLDNHGQEEVGMIAYVPS